MDKKENGWGEFYYQGRHPRLLGAGLSMLGLGLVAAGVLVIWLASRPGFPAGDLSSVSYLGAVLIGLAVGVLYIGLSLIGGKDLWPGDSLSNGSD